VVPLWAKADEAPNARTTAVAHNFLILFILGY
jgi:hypothetical protein